MPVVAILLQLSTVLELAFPQHRVLGSQAGKGHLMKRDCGVLAADSEIMIRPTTVAIASARKLVSLPRAVDCWFDQVLT